MLQIELLKWRNRYQPRLRLTHTEGSPLRVRTKFAHWSPTTLPNQELAASSSPIAPSSKLDPRCSLLKKPTIFHLVNLGEMHFGLRELYLNAVCAHSFIPTREQYMWTSSKVLDDLSNRVRVKHRPAHTTVPLLIYP